MTKLIQMQVSDDLYADILAKAKPLDQTVPAFCRTTIAAVVRGVSTAGITPISNTDTKDTKQSDTPNPVGRPKGKSKATLEREEKEWAREWKGIAAAGERWKAARAAEMDTMDEFDRLAAKLAAEGDDESDEYDEMLKELDAEEAARKGAK